MQDLIIEWAIRKLKASQTLKTAPQSTKGRRTVKVPPKKIKRLKIAK